MFHYLQSFYSRKRSIILIIIVNVGIIAAFFPSLFAFKSQAECDYNNNYSFSRNYITFVLPTMIIILMTGIPDIVFFVGNIAIMLRVWRYRRAVNSADSQTSEDKSLVRVTRTAVTLSSLHLILTLPSVIYFIKPRQIEAGGGISAEFILSAGIFNFATNILVYIVTSQTFRSELYTLLTCYLGKN